MQEHLVGAKSSSGEVKGKKTSGSSMEFLLWTSADAALIAFTLSFCSFLHGHFACDIEREQDKTVSLSKILK